jgi:hypothetical protein
MTKPVYYDYSHFTTLLKDRNNEPYVHPRASTIERHLNKTLHHGDVVNFDDDRALHSFIVVETADNKKSLMANPDNAGSGYVSIPLAVTGTVPDAIKFCSKLIVQLGLYLNDIELANTDATIKKIFTRPSDIQVHGRFQYFPLTNELGIVYKNKFRMVNLSHHDVQLHIEQMFAAEPAAKAVVVEPKKVKKGFFGLFKKK